MIKMAKDLKQFIEEKSVVLKSYEENYKATKNIRDFELKIDKVILQEKIDSLANNTTLAISKEKIEEIVYAIISGKHIILYGPPGTGKTTIAKEIANIFNCEFNLVTATADWSTYHTVGGLKLVSKAGQEVLEPVNGHIVESIIKCCNYIGIKTVEGASQYSGNWLVIDELNRANMDSAFGQVFTALDPDNSYIKLDFQNEELKKELYVPRRFRIIGTINNYDKDFLFHISYALMRRFSYIYIGVPQTREEKKNELNAIKNKIIEEVNRKLNLDLTINDLEAKYNEVIKDLSEIIYTIRMPEGDKLSRDIGFAQFKDTLKYVVLSNEVLPNDPKRLLDMSLASNIIPQLEGLPRPKIQDFQTNLISKFSYLSDYTNNALEQLTRR